MKFSTSLSAGIGALTLIAGSLFVAQPAAAAGIEIPDPELKACINRELRQSETAEITAEQAEKITKLDCRISEMASISGIGSLSYLSTLSLGRSANGQAPLSDLTPLIGLTKLTSLNIARAQVKDLAPLSQITSLEALRLFRTNVEDVSPINNLPSLKTVDIALNPITDFTKVADLIDRNATVDIASTVRLPAVNARAVQLNSCKATEMDKQRLYAGRNAKEEQVVIAADKSSWYYTSPGTDMGVTCDFEYLGPSRNFTGIVFYTQDVLGVPSTLRADEVRTEFKNQLLIDVLANDGAESEATILPDTLMLLNANGEPVNSLSLPEGTFSVEAGKISFTPTAGFSGTVPAVSYQVGNSDSITSTAKITVMVGAAPAIVTPVTPPTTPEPAQPANKVAPAGIDAKATAQEELANTGATTSAPLAFAGLLLLAGIAAMLLSRRRAT
ncbi:MAG: LPXTG cell wall anchor domain-containing protein [Renibacterium salmoninarum]|nr:LPXTG cell wall anchor domain-containing protein [Renibacterium salmoninarum]